MSRCYLCNNKKVEFFKKTKNRKLLYCRNCSIIYVEKGRKKRLIPENKFFSEYLSYQKFFDKYFKTLLTMIARYKKKGKLLDIGCGAGIFLDEAKKKGWKVAGVEASDNSASFSKSKGLKIFNTIVEKAKITPNSYDVVTMFQLIEHLENPAFSNTSLRLFMSNMNRCS